MLLSGENGLFGVATYGQQSYDFSKFAELWSDLGPVGPVIGIVLGVCVVGATVIEVGDRLLRSIP